MLWGRIGSEVLNRVSKIENVQTHLLIIRFLFRGFFILRGGSGGCYLCSGSSGCLLLLIGALHSGTRAHIQLPRRCAPSEVIPMLFNPHLVLEKMLRYFLISEDCL